MATAPAPAAAPTTLDRWLRIDPTSKPEVYLEIDGGADFTSLSYWLQILFSAGIATLGLVLNSPAVIIGAMLISPLMGPIMAIGLGLAAGDLYLTLKAIANLVASMVVAILVSALIVWLLPFHSATTEILARTKPNLLDLGIALFSGLAGSVAVCRPGKVDGSAVPTLPGVAIAVALMPPLCTMGFGLGAGANTRIMGGAGLLFLTNLVAIVSSAFVVFLLVEMNSPAVRARLQPVREGDRFVRRISHGPLGHVIAGGRALHWRVLTLAVLLGIIAVPLHTALKQVAGETLARDAVQSVVAKLVPHGALVSQQVEVGQQNIAIRLVSTSPIPDASVHEAERQIEQRTHRKTSIDLSSVASQSELAQLTERLNTASAVPPPAPPPPPKTLAEIHADLLARYTPLVQAVWPTAAPLQSFDLDFTPDAVVLHARYQANRDLTPIARDLLTQTLRDKLSAPKLTLQADRVAPPRHTRR
jgi:uncharacterized hydrophobic protein (TIGR00271 family)